MKAARFPRTSSQTPLLARLSRFDELILHEPTSNLCPTHCSSSTLMDDTLFVEFALVLGVGLKEGSQLSLQFPELLRNGLSNTGYSPLRLANLLAVQGFHKRLPCFSFSLHRSKLSVKIVCIHTCVAKGASSWTMRVCRRPMQWSTQRRGGASSRRSGNTVFIDAGCEDGRCSCWRVGLVCGTFGVEPVGSQGMGAAHICFRWTELIVGPFILGVCTAV